MPHTPGPWKAIEDITPHCSNGWKVVSEYIEGTHVTIVEMLTESNAKLIGASPELLAACEPIVELFEACKVGYESGRGHGAASWYATSRDSFEQRFAGMSIKPEVIAAIVAAVAKATK